MTILSPTDLETANYNQALWQKIYNKNVQLLNSTLLKVRALLDVDPTGLVHGSYLVWNSSTQKWEAEHK